MRAPARSSTPVVVITDPRVGAPGPTSDRLSGDVDGITRAGISLWTGSR
jgi:hypothetical protein